MSNDYENETLQLKEQIRKDISDTQHSMDCELEHKGYSARWFTLNSTLKRLKNQLAALNYIDGE